MNNNFRVGDTVENISVESEHYGEMAKVISVDGNGGGAVQYEDGYAGKAKTLANYYQKVARTSTYKAGATRPYVETQKTGIMHNITKFVKNMTMSADDKLLVKEGLMTEDGIFSTEAIAIVMQDLCEANKARLVTVATAMKANRKDEDQA